MRKAASPLALAALALAAFAAEPCASFALEPGRKVPGVSAEKWYFEDERTASPSGQASPLETPQNDLVLVFDANAPGSFAVLKLVEALKAANPQRLRDVKAVARNSAKELDEFFARNGKLLFPVAADTPSLASFKAFCDTESMLPMAFLSEKSGVLVWTGHPTGVEAVLRRIADGSFSVESQRRISSLRSELQTAIQSGLGAVVLKNADRILAIDPADMVAIQAKLFVYEGQGRFQDAKSFLAEACAKSPKDSELRFVYLGLLLRGGELDAFKLEAAKAFDEFKKGDAASLARLAAFLMDSSPFGEMPVSLALESARAYAASVPDGASPEMKAYAFELLAKASYFSCKPKDAVELQEKACQLRKGGHYETPALKLLEFYRQIAN